MDQGRKKPPVNDKETRLANLSTVWVQAQVFQNDLGRIKVGDIATLTVDTFPGHTFRGRVNFIYPQLDMDTRTAKVRIVFSNPDPRLKPDMFNAVWNIRWADPLAALALVPLVVREGWETSRGERCC